jgi:hypothetical protein
MRARTEPGRRRVRRFACIGRKSTNASSADRPAGCRRRPDLPAAPTPPLPAQATPAAGMPPAETYPAAPRAADNPTANHGQDARAASGGGDPGIDAGARRARRRQRRLRGTTPTLGTAPARAGVPLRLNLARHRPRSDVLVSGRGVSTAIRFSPTTAIGSPHRRPRFSTLVAIGSPMRWGRGPRRGAAARSARRSACSPGPPGPCGCGAGWGASDRPVVGSAGEPSSAPGAMSRILSGPRASPGDDPAQSSCLVSSCYHDQDGAGIRPRLPSNELRRGRRGAAAAVPRSGRRRGPAPAVVRAPVLTLSGLKLIWERNRSSSTSSSLRSPELFRST